MQSGVIREPFESFSRHQKTHEIELETICCPSCSSGQYFLKFRSEDINFAVPGIFTLVTCKECNLSYLNPRPTADTVRYAYPSSYSIGYAQSSSDIHSEEYKTRLLIIKQHTLGTRLLEIGSAAGHFLYRAKEAGYSVEGVEPDEVTAAYAVRKYGFKVFNSMIEDTTLEPNTYDVICMFDVLEHTLQPREALQKLFQSLRAGGSLVIQVPNFSSLEASLFRSKWYGKDVPRDILFFTPETITRILQKAGFQEVKIVHRYMPNYTLLSISRLFKKKSNQKFEIKATFVSESPIENVNKKWLFRMISYLLNPIAYVLTFFGQSNAIVAIARRS